MGVPHTDVFPGQSTSDYTSIAYSTMAARARSVMLSSDSPEPQCTIQHSELLKSQCSSGFHTWEFLQTVLMDRFGVPGTGAILQGLRGSTIHQYQSCLSTFQSFLPEGSVYHFGGPVFEFLFHDKHSAPGTVATHLATIADPLWYRFRLTLDARTLNPSPIDVLHRALSLMALVTGQYLPAMGTHSLCYLDYIWHRVLSCLSPLPHRTCPKISMKTIGYNLSWFMFC